MDQDAGLWRDAPSGANRLSGHSFSAEETKGRSTLYFDEQPLQLTGVPLYDTNCALAFCK